MEQDSGAVCSGRPWIGPAVVLRTIVAVLAGALFFIVLDSAGALSLSILGAPAYVWVVATLALAWLASLATLLIMRASYRYVLHQGSAEVEQGIVSKKLLVVSPSAFSELEVDQGIIGRMLNYGSLQVRSQGGQQLNLMLIRDPKRVSLKIRGVMAVPTVRDVKEERVVATTTA